MKFKRENKQIISQESLDQMVKAPVIDLIIRYDGRTGLVGVMAIGGKLPFEVAYQLLEMARGVIRTQEIEAVKANGNGAAGGAPKEKAPEQDGAVDASL